MTPEEHMLMTLLNSFGDIVELDFDIDADAVIEELKQLEFMEGTNFKRGLNLTGPMDDLGLHAKDKHNADQEYNDNLLNCPSLIDFFNCWDTLARCRAVEMNAGSFFKMHRDAWRMNPQIRVFIPLNKTEVHEWNFIYGEERVPFKAGKPYILNTRKQHGSFAMVDGIYHVVMSIYLTEANVKAIFKMMPNCKED